MLDLAHTATGDACWTPGVYRTNDACSWRVFMGPRECFPDCPHCSQPVTWLYVGSDG